MHLAVVAHAEDRNSSDSTKTTASEFFSCDTLEKLAWSQSVFTAKVTQRLRITQVNITLTIVRTEDEVNSH